MVDPFYKIHNTTLMSNLWVETPTVNGSLNVIIKVLTVNFVKKLTFLFTDYFLHEQSL